MVHPTRWRFVAVLALVTLVATTAVGCMMVGKVAGKLMTKKTSDLSTAAVQARFTRNLYTPDTKTTEAQYVGADWVEGRNMAVINFQKREGIGFYEIDGDVTLDGRPIEHLANGFYGVILDEGDTSPKTFEVETTSGQRVSFRVGPAEPVTIRTVDGKSDDIEISMNEDFTLELENPAGAEGSEIRLAFLHDVMGTRSWQEVGIFRSADRITVPHEVFVNNGGNVAVNTGETFMMVERFRVEPVEARGVGASQVIATSWDVVPVTLTGEIEKGALGIGVENLGLTAEGEVGQVSYTARKPSAFLGPPFSHGRKFAVVSFSVRATKLKQQRSKTTSSTSSWGSYQVKTTTTTTETRTFPQFTDAAWEAVVEDLYVDFEQALTDEWDIELIPVEQVLTAPSYAELEPIDDQITEVEVEKSYKGTKNLIPTTLGAIMGNVSTTFASDRIDARLTDELGVDGIIAVTIDLEMPWEEFKLAPRMSFRISGPPNGYTHGPTIWATGVVEGAGTAIDTDAIERDPLGWLHGVMQSETMMLAFDEAVDGLAEQEREAGYYEKIWALK